MEFWERAATAAVVIAIAAAVAKLVDWRIGRRQLTPEIATRYRVLRRTVMTAIVVVGVLSALLVVPQVRGVVGAILASGAILAAIIGFASQRTIGNAVAGLLIAFTQPLRLGDEVEVAGHRGVVEEIGLTYTYLKTPDNARVVIPNEKLASDTIVNSTIRAHEKLAEVTLQIPLNADLESVLDALREETKGEREPDVELSSLEGTAKVTIRAWAPDEAAADRLEAELRLRAHRRLRETGVFA